MSVKIGDIRKLLSGFLSESNYTQIAVLVDGNSFEYCYPIVQYCLPANHHVILIPEGEKNKNLDTCQIVWTHLTRQGFDRKSLLINLGGGVVGDLGGFCAASFKRGIAFINIPTTLLSMVDASVGGKLGIDFMGLKNHIGFFTEPNAVFIDPIFLQTLEKKQLLSGYAEVLKHGLIKDASYWQYATETNPLEADYREIIERSVEIKTEIVKADPTEKGLRKILNFGHTLGHALESYFLKSSKMLLHGEAIILGMIAETYLSVELCGLPANHYQDIKRKLKILYPKLKFKESHIDEILKFTFQDKKNEGGNVKLSLLKEIGVCVYDIPCGIEKMKAALIDCLR